MFRERVSALQGDLSADRDVPCPCRAVLSRDQEVLSVHLERRQERATVPLQTLECVIERYNRAAPADFFSVEVLTLSGLVRDMGTLRAHGIADRAQPSTGMPEPDVSESWTNAITSAISRCRVGGSGTTVVPAAWRSGATVSARTTFE
jgi:hypothetical protein